MSEEPDGDEVRPESGKWTTIAPWPALAVAAIYTGFLALNLRMLVAAININSDAAWAPVLVSDLAHGPRGGLIKVGQAAHFTTLWWLSVTRSFPLRELFWTASPFLLFLATAALVAWAAARAAGRWAGLLTLSVSLCAGPLILITSLPQGLRGHTWFAGALLSAVLVWAARAPRPVRLTAPAFLAAGIVAGATAASDPLFLAAGLLPFAGAALLARFLAPADRAKILLVHTAGYLAVAVLVAAAVGNWAESAGYRKTYLAEGVSFAGLPQVPRNLKFLAGNVLMLLNGYFFDRPVGFLSVASVVLAVLSVCLLVWSLRWTALRIRRRAQADTDPAAIVLMAYWGLTVVFVCGAFALTGVAGEAQLGGSRFLVPVFYAAAVFAGLWGVQSPLRRPLAAGAVVLFGLSSFVSRDAIAAYEQLPVFRPVAEHGAAAISFLKAEGLTRGYAGYWSSHGLTLRSGMQVHFYPVNACRRPESEMLCPFYVNIRTQWYRPVAGRTFLLTDGIESGGLTDPPPPALGSPQKVRHFGGLTVYIYPTDIAGRFLPPCPGEHVCPGEPFRNGHLPEAALVVGLARHRPLRDGTWVPDRVRAPR